jgi:hypothetical protein
VSCNIRGFSRELGSSPLVQWIRGEYHHLTGTTPLSCGATSTCLHSLLSRFHRPEDLCSLPVRPTWCTHNLINAQVIELNGASNALSLASLISVPSTWSFIESLTVARADTRLVAAIAFSSFKPNIK